ncbi:MAG TPA: NAD(P)/FAD-dependent oxidoreductase [Candidatus Poseidoniales archaeon]|jgi:geranylgeranyl reductase family protein|nr:MAG: hypothetical protein CXT71_08325 [Euryarchaeota archaeon]HIF46281.1 NAD(P)/FAD-dependent oxidoreductase [Candidatus Poseidoniales archaeon]HIL65595.1 NAD(P)/FAD-dependent oxidoreductase [Candidatus Poseidoniales archaeon]
MHWQVVIVGAGPVGGRLACELATKGVTVLMLEEHNEVGRPFQCAGLINPPAMKMVGLEQTILQNIDGALIHSPSGIEISVGTKGKVRTHVVCRKRFDQGVVAQAMEAGAHLWLKSKPLGAVNSSDKVQLSVEKGSEKIDLSCDLLIGADGAHSWTRRHFKMGKPKELMIGYQTDVIGLSDRGDWLEMYTGNEVAPGFFAWVIPSGRGTHRIGVWGRAKDLDGRSMEDIHQALVTHPQWKERFEGMKEIAKYCGPIPCGLVSKPYLERVLLIGDAAGMAKPTTGGGIGPAFRQIEAIIENLAISIKTNKLTKSDLAKVCKPYKAMKKDQDRARALRDLLITLPDDLELDSHFEMFNRPEVLELINAEGDIEHPVPLGLALLKRVPEFRKLAIKAGVKLLFA